MARITTAKDNLLALLESATHKNPYEKNGKVYEVIASSIDRCAFPGCEEVVCSQCAHKCCRSNITHCHAFGRKNLGLRCFFHPPPRDNAANAVLVGGRWQQGV